MDTDRRTSNQHWERYWQEFSNATEVRRTRRRSLINEILDLFDRYLPVNPNFDVLEIGGASGRYLLYMAKTFKYKIHSLDYSTAGNDLTQTNCRRAGVEVVTYGRDFLAKDLNRDLPLFDVVYSLGFIEHFDQLNDIVKRHVELLKPGGLLLIGAPNLRGVYRLFLSQTAPSRLVSHNLEVMKLSNWDAFERELNLDRLFRGYIGGLEPSHLTILEKRTPWTLFLNMIGKATALAMRAGFSFIRRFNSRFWSGYVIGVYRKK